MIHYEKQSDVVNLEKSRFCENEFADNVINCNHTVRSAQTLIEKSRECHNQKPQPTPNTKRKRKRTKITYFPKRSDHNAERTWEKHEKKEHNKTKQEAPRSINHKATQNKNNTGTTASRRSVA